MQLPDRNLVESSADLFNRKLQTNYERLKDLLRPFDPSIPEELNVENLWSLSQRHHLDLDLFLRGQFNFETFKAQIAGDSQILPEKYLQNGQQLSRGRSVLTILDAVALYFGDEFCSNLLNRLQISGRRTFDPDEFLSMHLLVDLLTEVSRLGISNTDFRWLGFRSALVNRGTELGKIIYQFNTGDQIYRSMHEECMHFFDKNCKYEIQRLSKNSNEIKITTREQTQEIFKSRTVGSREVCLVRQGVYASMTLPVLGYPASIHESHCMHVDGDYCLYHLSWESPRSKPTPDL